MADPKESPEIPETALPEETPGVAASVESDSASERDPVLEALLKSKSSDDEEDMYPAKGGKGKRSPKKSSKKGIAKTGTSLDRKSKKSKLPLIASIAAVALIIGGGGTALWLTLSPASSQVDPDRNKDKTQQAGTKKSDPKDEANAPWNTEKGIFPIPLDDWQKQPSPNGLSPEEETALLQTLLGSDLNTAANILPSEAGGFTSNDDLIFNEDGSVNGLYSYWTKESFTAGAGQIIEKFLNPRFGSWEAYQGRGSDPNGIDPAALFPRTFTDDMLKSKEPVSKWLPIYADWNNDGYGRGDLAATGAKWYGTVVSSTSDFVWDEATSQYTVSFVGNVKFTAYKSNGEKVSEKGVLTLEFVANPGGERGTGGKVLVNRSSLTIGG